MTLRKPTTSFWCLLFVVLILVALVYLPDLVHKKTFQFPLSGGPAVEEKAFPIDQILPFVSGEKRAQASLRQLAAESPKGILVNFWATWCPPCIEELPSLEFLHRQLTANSKPPLPKLITISVDEKSEAISSLYKTLEFKPSFPVLHDKEGETARLVGTTKFPETYWINAEGKILHKWIGPQNWLGPDVLKTLSVLSGG